MIRRRKRIDDAPVLLLAAARSGSTLLQRALNTSPGLAIWGEHFGVVSELRATVERLDAHDDQLRAGNQEADHVTATPPWTGGLHPQAGPVTAAVYRAAVKAMLADLFGGALPRDVRWGFKEVRYRAEDLGFWEDLFPATQTIVLARRPAALVSSFIRAPWRDLRSDDGALDWEAVEAHARRGVDAWRRTYESFAPVVHDPTRAVRAVTYEALIEPGGTDLLAELFAWLDVDPPDATVLAQVLDTRALSSDGNESWSAAERSRLDEIIDATIATDEHVAAVVGSYYGPDEVPS